jgi:hypothetical protein
LQKPPWLPPSDEPLLLRKLPKIGGVPAVCRPTGGVLEASRRACNVALLAIRKLLLLEAVSACTVKLWLREPKWLEGEGLRVWRVCIWVLLGKGGKAWAAAMRTSV